ncbi:MAG: YebC/PmpR family DNA-binding transcriptional regulator [Akkermansia sp.]
MSGHNKWSKIKFQKAATDAKKGKVFARFSHEITLAAKSGGGDTDTNPRLRAAIEGAKAASMPKDNIDRAVKKGTGELTGSTIIEVTYEGYGPAATAFIVEAATDNTNRTSSDLRTIFGKNGGNMGTPGSVSYQFDRKGEVRLIDAAMDEDSAMELAMDAGAEEFEQGDDDGEWVFTCGPTELQDLTHALTEAGKKVTGMTLVSIPQTPVEITDLATAQKVLKIYELLDDYDDTLNVFSNFEISDEILAQL